MSPVMRKPAFCILCKTKAADYLRDKRAALAQRLCFCYIAHRLYFLDSKFQAQPFSVSAQLALCRAWSEIQKTGLLTNQLISDPAR